MSRSLWKRKDGRWGGEERVRDPRTGGIVKVSATARTRKEVVARLEGRAQRVKDHKAQRDSTCTFADAATSWASSLADVAQYSATTRELYSGDVRRYLADGGLAIGEIPLSKLRGSDFEDALGEMRSRGLSASVRRRFLTISKAIIRREMRDGRLGFDPTQGVNRPKSDPIQPKAHTAAEVREILTRTSGTRVGNLVVFLAHTGMRVGEALALQWPDVDFDASTVRISGTLVRITGEGVYKAATKTKGSKRTVPLNSYAVEALRRQAQMQTADAERAHSKYEFSGYIFTGDFGNVLDLRNASRAYKDALKSDRDGESIESSFHRLRHSFATLLVGTGESANTVAAILGHNSTRVTLETYAAALDEFKSQATDRLGSLYEADSL
ncbi:MAG: site-specific integrase [Actinobacteria bacterium]|nr:site-specific integrase [Actinomycetota bacterium]